MSYCLKALLLCILFGSVLWTEAQAQMIRCQRAPDETSEDDRSLALESPELSDSETNVCDLYLSAGQRGTLIFRVPAREDDFPDVLLTLDLLLPSSNVDVYCRPGTLARVSAGFAPAVNEYEWKSDHRHGNDYVFISKHHPELRRYTEMTESGILVANIACSLVEEAGISAPGTLEINYSYATRDLAKREQKALDNIFQECCQGEERCKKWKEHIEQDNAEAADFCHYLGNYCDEGHLIRLNLNNQNMSCTFPGQELAKLERLEKLQLKGNQLKGRLNNVFEDVLEFKSLEQLEISEASFSGALAEDPTDRDAFVCEIARQGVLIHLDLVDCGITGPVPHCLMDPESKLREINFYGNQLSGELPRVQLNESRLLNLVLAKNELTGKIPKSWTAFRNLQALDLSSNQLSGDIPKGFNNSQHLQHINLENNQLTGSLPEDLAAGRDMTNLNISHNQLTGELPDNFFTAARNLILLDLQNNSLSGPIPPSVANATNLVSLDLSYNQFSGSIPSELGDLTYLFTLFLHNNALSGPLPASLGRLQSLHAIYFQSNALNGTIPEEWKTLGFLRHLRLDDNQLEGEILGWMLHLYNPAFLVYLRVNLTSNNFSGFDEEWYDIPTTPSGIVVFFAAHNQIKGEFPSELARQNNLKLLDLSSNKMTGKLPSAEDSLREVLSLNLSNNAFTGKIPKSWAKTDLVNSSGPTTMDLSNNKLSGKIPEFLYVTENSDVDRQFFLQGNKFDYECPLPSDFSNIQDLECEEAEASIASAGGSPEASLEGEEAEASIASISRSAEDLEEKNQEEAASARTLSDDFSNQASPSISSVTSSSSSNILVPIVATISAVCFAVFVLLVAMMIKKRKNQKDSIVAQADISLSKWPNKQKKSMGETKDNEPMYDGADSTVPL